MFSYIELKALLANALVHLKISRSNEISGGEMGTKISYKLLRCY